MKPDRASRRSLLLLEDNKGAPAPASCRLRKTFFRVRAARLLGHVPSYRGGVATRMRRRRTKLVAGCRLHAQEGAP